MSAQQRKNPEKHAALSKATTRVEQVDPHRDTGEKPSGTRAQKPSDICIYMHNTHVSLSLSAMHTHTQPHMHGLTQPWNPLRLGDLAKQLIHSAFDLFPIFSLQSANWEKQKRRGDCCMSPGDQTKERPRDWQSMLLSTTRKICERLFSWVVLNSFTNAYACLYQSMCVQKNPSYNIWGTCSN